MDGRRPALVVGAGLVLVAGLVAALVIAGPNRAPRTAPSLPPPAAWDVLVTSDMGKQMRLRVVDESGRLVGARPAQRDPAFGDDMLALALGQRADPRTLIVGWPASVCDKQAELRLFGDGRTLRLTFAPRGGCDLVATGYAVELEFRDLVDPSTLDGRINE
jgi:hypothetical protein